MIPTCIGIIIGVALGNVAFFQVIKPLMDKAMPRQTRSIPHTFYSEPRRGA